MGEQLVIQTAAPWWVQVFEYLGPHWWGIAAVLVSPIVGFAATQRFKAHAEIVPSSLQLAAISGMVTFVLSFVMWLKAYRDIEGAALVAIMMGVGYPILFTVIMGAARRWWPWGYARLSGRSATVVTRTEPDSHVEDGEEKTEQIDKEKTYFPKW